MEVVVTDRRFTECDPYSQAVEDAGGELTYAECETLDDVVEACRDATVVVTFKAPITAEVIREMSEARLVLRNGTGHDNVDVRAATDADIPVSVIPDYCTQEVAEHAVTLALAAAHDVVEADRDLRSSEGWGRREPVLPLAGRTFGVIGLGRIGRAAAGKARGLGMEVIGYDPYQPDDIFEATDVERVDFDGLLAEADVVSVHAPLTGETHRMLAAGEFRRMKPDAVVVNTARGGIVDERSLVDAIERGELRAAGLDVFEEEPPNRSPAFGTDRVVVSPHHGGSSERTRRRCIEIGREKITAALRGDDLGEIVNPEVFGPAHTSSPEYEYWSESGHVDFS